MSDEKIDTKDLEGQEEYLEYVFESRQNMQEEIEDAWAAFAAGKKAYLEDGTPLDKNPYRKNTLAFRIWKDIWMYNASLAALKELKRVLDSDLPRINDLAKQLTVIFEKM